MITFRRHPDIDAVLFEFVGEFTLGEYFDGMEAFLGSDVFRPGINTLWDFRQVSVDSVTPGILRSVAQYNQTLAPNRGETWKVALVVSAEVAFGLSRMFSAYVDSAPNDVQVFRSMDDAEAWLSASPPMGDG